MRKHFCHGPFDISLRQPNKKKEVCVLQHRGASLSQRASARTSCGSGKGPSQRTHAGALGSEGQEPRPARGSDRGWSGGGFVPCEPVQRQRRSCAASAPNQPSTSMPWHQSARQQPFPMWTLDFTSTHSTQTAYNVVKKSIQPAFAPKACSTLVLFLPNLLQRVFTVFLYKPVRHRNCPENLFDPVRLCILSAAPTQACIRTRRESG